jgi:hypothetical protein
MKRFVLLALGLTLLGGLAGCDHPSARLSSLQDPKYPVLRTSKIALPDSVNAPTVDLATRLAGESLKEQLQSLGFNLVPVAAADFQLGFTIGEKDEPVTFDETVPTFSTVMGLPGPRPMTGTILTDQVVPSTRMVDMTQLDVTLRRTQDPPVEVWSGHITANTGDTQKYRAEFFRALLEHIGETTHGTAPLDSDQPNSTP